MNNQSVGIDSKSHGLLRQIARRQRRTMQAALGEAVETYRRKLIAEQTNKVYSKLKGNPIR